MDSFKSIYCLQVIMFCTFQYTRVVAILDVTFVCEYAACMYRFVIETDCVLCDVGA